MCLERPFSIKILFLRLIYYVRFGTCLALYILLCAVIKTQVDQTSLVAQ